MGKDDEVHHGPRVLRHGARAFLLEFDDLDAVVAHHAAVLAAGLPGVVEVVPAARTLFVEVDPTVTSVELVAERTRRLSPLDVVGTERPVVEVEVRYDGPDLADVARLAQASVEEVVRRHTALTWRTAFIGFTPGFAYLVPEGAGPEAPGWLPEVPRRPEPRVQVPTGAVGLAGGFTGIYPRSSPGGWQLIGSTDAVLWDPARPEPALLPAGARVRFVEAG